MIKKLFAGLLACVVFSPAMVARATQDAAAVAFTADDLDNLFAPIALYPDPLIAQVLPASTFVDQVEAASRAVQGVTDTTKIDKMVEKEAWDVSVKAVAHYPQVISMMAGTLDWTTAIGQAYVTQSTDVMSSIQRLRARAKAAGTLVSTPQHEVIVDQSAIRIVPAQPQVIYVPQYDPQVVYVDDDNDGEVLAGAIAFTAGLAMGAWLNNDCDWHGGHVYYHGWSGNVGWVNASRAHVNVNSVYVNRSYTNVNVNRSCVNRNVNYNNVSSYNNVNRNANYNNRKTNVNNTNVNNANRTMNKNVNAANPKVDSHRKPATPAARPTSTPAARPASTPAARPASAPAAKPAARPAAQPPRQPAAQPHGFGEPKGKQATAADSNRGKASRESANRNQAAPKPKGGGGGRGGGGGGGRRG